MKTERVRRKSQRNRRNGPRDVKEVSAGSFIGAKIQAASDEDKNQTGVLQKSTGGGAIHARAFSRFADLLYGGL